MDFDVMKQSYLISCKLNSFFLYNLVVLIDVVSLVISKHYVELF